METSRLHRCVNRASKVNQLATVVSAEDRVGLEDFRGHMGSLLQQIHTFKVRGLQGLLFRVLALRLAGLL